MTGSRFLSVILMIGCSTACGIRTAKVPATLNIANVKYTVSELKSHRDGFEKAMKKSPPDVTTAKYYRDSMINLSRRDIEANYRAYEVEVASTRQRLKTAVDILGLSASTAATITNGERAKTVISAMAALLQGTHSTIDKETFGNQATGAVIQKMRASRLQVEERIIRKMAQLDPLQYGFAEAEKDLQEFFWAGTLLSALLDLTEDAAESAKAQRAKREQAERIRLSKVSEAQLDLSARVGERMLALEQRVVSALNSTDTQKKVIVAELKTILEAITGSAPAEDDPTKLARLLRAEVAKAVSDPSLLPKIAEALGIKLAEEQP